MDFDQWVHRVVVLRDGDADDVGPLDVVRGLTELFSSAGRLAEKYSTGQINAGLWFLVGECDMLHGLYDKGVDQAVRVRCADSIRQLYRQLFTPLCQKVLSNGREGRSGDEPLNSICYMWWDVFPTWGRPDRPESREINFVLLDVMRETLGSDNVACVESGLHGLGHWHLSYPEQTEAIIDGFLRARQDISSPLKQYASDARSGRVL
ncbi:hypothetical protein [Planotetraspora sp. GP83]|uniref:hypothetical protein n=1 Tax=Planotetraspora sp. GP83 TaxID=3156264 RepID=UPI003511D7B7